MRIKSFDLLFVFEQFFMLAVLILEGIEPEPESVDCYQKCYLVLLSVGDSLTFENCVTMGLKRGGRLSIL